MKALYHAHGHATGGRTGAGATDDNKVNVIFSTPKELGGDGGSGTNPEQLFSVGYSACFLGALKFVAGQEKVKIPEDTTVHTTIGIGPRDDGTGFGITATLKVHIPGMDHETAHKLVHKADIVCPYSHAVRGNIHKEVEVV
ncbi:MAG: organic hydroperoxide resistance protein [Acidocella sp.]|nr:organic hydroperoxide resistance protein [Acidocella sp.]